MRPARALPYQLAADARAKGSTLTVDLRNSGRVAAVFHVRSSAHDPRSYTVGAGQRMSDDWTFSTQYNVEIHGPNGFFRRFRGPGGIDVQAREDGREFGLVLSLANHTGGRVVLSVIDVYSGRPVNVPLKPGETRTQRWSLDRTHGWYDLTVTGPSVENRYAGHVENGEPSISDPVMGGLSSAHSSNRV